MLDGIRISNFSSGVRFVLDKGREKIRYKITDPAGFGDQINGFNEIAMVQEAIAKCQRSYQDAIRAEQLTAAGNIRQAIDEWKKLFGDYFPSYG